MTGLMLSMVEVIMKDKIIIFGNDPRGYTGFGKIVDHLVDAVSDSGFMPIVVALKAGPNKDYKKAKIYNTSGQAGNHVWSTLENTLIEEKAKMVITIGDPWDIQGIVEIKQRSPFFWIGYTPVESTPYPRYILLVQNPQQYLDVAFIMKNMDHIVTYSGFGKDAVTEMLKEAFQNNSHATHIPEMTKISLGVDSRFYSPEDRIDARGVFAEMVSQDDFLFTCAKVNSMRSGFDSLLFAWSIYMKKAKESGPELAERSKLYLHTNVEGSGYPIPIIMKRYSIENSLLLNQTLKLGSGYPEEDMVDMYNASDISLSATRGEGFGLNILEAMSCKVPCIIPDYGCPSEYGGNAVARVQIAATYNPEFATTDFAIIDVHEMANMMFDLARDPETRKKMGEEGRKIAKSMSWDKFTEKWKDIIRTS